MDDFEPAPQIRAAPASAKEGEVRLFVRRRERNETAMILPPSPNSRRCSDRQEAQAALYRRPGASSRLCSALPACSPRTTRSTVARARQHRPDRVVDGEDFAGHKIHASFTRMDPGSFPLVERGFNWIQEQPHNQ